MAERNTKTKIRDYYVAEVHSHNLLRRSAVRMSGYQLAFCLSGHITMKVSDQEIRYEQGSFAIFSPFNTLEVSDASEDFRCTLVMFQKSFLTETLNNIYFLERFQLLRNKGIGYVQLTAEEHELIWGLIHRIKRIIGEDAHAFQKEIIRSEIIIFLYEIENILLSRDNGQTANAKHIGKEKRLADFQQLLVKHFYKERKVTFYANALNTSIAQLSKLLTDTTGRTAKEHIDELRLMQAKHLLKAGKYNVSEVASLLYYDNIEEFSRFFKKKTGTSPLRYAKEK
ncbi:helix-turn-helix domain-containing protein [Flexibacter flexilis]|nr:helix-turn-helix domain-containing protein [Flexibacter flexilis]